MRNEGQSCASCRQRLHCHLQRADERVEQRGIPGRPQRGPRELLQIDRTLGLLGDIVITGLNTPHSLVAARATLTTARASFCLNPLAPNFDARLICSDAR
jgi:hypothetical protein